MKADFAQMLNSLRHERGWSQKKVADELGISQALLSHYENGVREPRLEFVIRAAEYYGVSSDYLLGISDRRCSGKLEQLCETDGARRCIANASVILCLLEDIGDERLAEDASDYLGCAMYMILMHLRYPDTQYDPLVDAAMNRAVSAFITRVRTIRSATDMLPDITDEILKEKFPEESGAVRELAGLIDRTIMQFM